MPQHAKKTAQQRASGQLPSMKPVGKKSRASCKLAREVRL
jgi:hypothetical protein